MKKKIILTTDLGTFKAFEVIERLQASSPSLEHLDSFETVYADDRISRRLADQAGQFGKGSMSFAAINDRANGERHNIHLEDERRSVSDRRVPNGRNRFQSGGRLVLLCSP